MRLKQLHIADFKNLRDFTISFADEFTTVLVGPNGTGKSNVLEALIIIFRDLDLGAPPAFAYMLEYACKGATVVIDADPSRPRAQVVISVDGDRVTPRRFSRRGGGEHLPNFVFGYYSGPSNRMESHFAQHQARFADELLRGEDQPLRPLLYARLVHSQFVLLSFFAREDQDRSILREHLRIEDLESVLFVLKKPYWYNPQRRGQRDDPGDPRFWGARGVVRDFLERLYELSLAPLQSRKTDRLYLFVKNKHDLMALARGYDGQQEFFKALESLYISDLIEDVRTSVEVAGVGSALTFRELSEGEQQLLTVLGLLRFVESREGLILLDEPDTHLNPAWSLHYVRLLKAQIGDPATTQIVMATHDPLVVAGLTAPEVLLLRREGEGAVSASHPDEDPKGMGIAGILTSEVYGLRSSLDLDTLRDLDRKRELAIQDDDDLSPPERRELAELNAHLGRLDFATSSVRDPLYKPFVEAMTRAEEALGLRVAVLTQDQREIRESLAAEVATEILRRRATREEADE